MALRDPVEAAAKRARVIELMQTPYYLTTEIAQMVGVALPTVSMIAVELGYQAPAERRREAQLEGSRRAAEARFADSKQAALIALMKKHPDLPLRAAAARVGLSLHTAQRYAKRHGIKAPPSPPRPRRSPGQSEPVTPHTGLLSGTAFAAIMAGKPGHGHKDEDRKRSFEGAMRHAQRVAVLPPLTEDEARRLIERHIAERGVTVCPSPEIQAPTNLGLGWGGARP